MKLAIQTLMFKRVSAYLLKLLRRTIVDAAIGTAFGTAFGVLYGVGEAMTHGSAGSILWVGLYFALCGAAAGAIGGAFGTLCGYAAGDSPKMSVNETAPAKSEVDVMVAREAQSSGTLSTNRLTPFFKRMKRHSWRPHSLN